jgi:hypothetical protein
MWGAIFDPRNPLHMNDKGTGPPDSVSLHADITFGQDVLLSLHVFLPY